MSLLHGAPLDLFFTCQVISDACPSVLYIHFNLGIIGKCLNTFWGTSDVPTALNLFALYLWQFWSFSWKPHNNICPFGHAWITLYANPSFCNSLEASCSLDGKVLGWGKMDIFNKLSNSLMKVVLVPWVRQQFNTSKEAAKPESCAPQYNGTHEASSNASWIVYSAARRAYQRSCRFYIWN